MITGFELCQSYYIKNSKKRNIDLIQFFRLIALFLKIYLHFAKNIYDAYITCDV